MKKYYVGAKHIAAAINRGENAGCMCSTIEEAISAAKCQIRHNEVDSAVIVKIIRIVRKEHPPIIVEEVD